MPLVLGEPWKERVQRRVGIRRIVDGAFAGRFEKPARGLQEWNGFRPQILINGPIEVDSVPVNEKLRIAVPTTVASPGMKSEPAKK